MHSFWVAAFVIVCVVSTTKGQDNDELIVETVSGKVKGRRATTHDAGKTYYAFQGIPYAEPPIDDLRFKAPVPAKKWTGLLKTQEDEHRCIQGMDSTGSEDCLYINVFTLSTESPTLPVMVWIYGGSFIIGDSKIKNYAPDYFSGRRSHSCYIQLSRFLSTEDEASPGNYALKDQILALKWVKENIHSFGGDPGKITLFGESAGSAAVSYLLQSPLTKNLYHRAILQSGTSLNLWSLSRNPRQTAFQIGKALDINTENSTVLVESLRRVDSKLLQRTSLSTDLVQTVLSNPRDGLIFAPSIEPEHAEAVVTKKSHEMLKFGDFNRVPCIVGFNSEEGVPYKEVIDYARLYLFTYDIFSSRLVPIDMNIDSYWTKIWVGISIKAHYFGLVPINFSEQALVEYVTDDQFVRAIYEFVTLLSKYVRVYFYRFSYQGQLGVDGKDRKIPGVGHAEDLNYMWRRETNIDDPPKADHLTSKRLVTLWTNFAKTSNPTPVPDEILQNIVWPPATFRNITYLDIGEDLKLNTSMVDYNIQFWKDLYASNGLPPFDTY
ncbi:hypothetical protein NQ318_018736 [Aromia moschata]|uniref:Carboxylic ester hydrolase n=1 Tax=Aromia moschata TaxID=1265417 RepID=A0AAV8ZG37_9CUCU|nr:hypothetical protein NQ318_018736 [Aromia moschata]